MVFSISPGSYWLKSDGRPPRYAALDGDLTADVAIIGAGITGLTAADHLVRQGRKVVVIEAGRVGSGTTGGTSAHLDAHPERNPRTHIRDFGEDAARAFTRARLQAIDFIEQRIGELGGDCDFKRIDAFLYTEDPDHADRLREQVSDFEKIGLPSEIAGQDVGLPFEPAFAVRFPRMARFHPIAYLRLLAEAVAKSGGIIHEETFAQPPEGGDRPTIETNRGTVRANAVLVTTHSPYLGISNYDMRVAPYQSYLIAARTGKPIGDALYWDDADPYHYIRIAGSSDPGLLLIGGGDHKTGQAVDERDAWMKLEDYARQRFGDIPVEQRWSAELFEPDDGVPFAGAVPSMKNVYLATGFSGVGLTFGTACGGLLADLVSGRDNELASIFSPARVKPLAEASEFVKENLNVAKEYVKGTFEGEKIDSLDEVPAGEGRLVRFKGHTLAVYRDGAGLTHAMSPACTHAGCNVHWNPAETTWDCPCHGGRYSATGERIYGPPPQDLKKKPLQEL
ncbi:MAG: FAD-dependent oxidoreductase [Planctomycetota bacterium]|nr:FAD-dependent oxidoreductase [Planctomycetaceae bacterium]MDQ3329403.1 FAD-dependent oxidoreductase [Planctomycetota bacterium]